MALLTNDRSPVTPGLLSSPEFSVLLGLCAESCEFPPAPIRVAGFSADNASSVRQPAVSELGQPNEGKESFAQVRPAGNGSTLPRARFCGTVEKRPVLDSGWKTAGRAGNNNLPMCASFCIEADACSWRSAVVAIIGGGVVMSQPDAGERKIIVDEDWKEQARREAEATQAAIDAERQQKQAPMPPASFALLVQSLVSQALIALGDAENPVTGERRPDLEMARFHIDMLGVLEEKTKGNLSRHEENLLRGWLFDLRLRYVQAASPPSQPAAPSSATTTTQG